MLVGADLAGAAALQALRRPGDRERRRRLARRTSAPPGDPGLAGVIIGRALYEGAVRLPEALAGRHRARGAPDAARPSLVVLAAVALAAFTYLRLERIGDRAWIPLACRAVAWSRARPSPPQHRLPDPR